MLSAGIAEITVPPWVFFGSFAGPLKGTGKKLHLLIVYVVFGFHCEARTTL